MGLDYAPLTVFRLFGLLFGAMLFWFPRAISVACEPAVDPERS